MAMVYRLGSWFLLGIDLMASTENFSSSNEQTEFLLRLPDVLKRYPVSRSSWLQGVKEGRHPAPVKIGARAVAWKSSDIAALIASL